MNAQKKQLQRQAFFAYPAEPPEVSTTIDKALPLLRDAKTEVLAWPQLDIFGGFIPDQVRRSIRKSNYSFFDITYPNSNVYYELGYAIGHGKPVGPLLNKGIVDASKKVQKLGIFDNLGYLQYANSRELSTRLKSRPNHKLLNVYQKEIDFRQPLYLLDTVIKTDFRNAIVSSIKSAKVFYRSFDPVETPRFSTPTVIADVSASAGVIIPILENHIVGHEEHNLRAAFVAGLAAGMRRKVLLIRLQTGFDNPPADFRDDVQSALDDRAVQGIVKKFAQETLQFAQTIDIPKADKSQALRAISMGAAAAENEFRTLAQYFVETSEFNRVQRGEVKIVTGRKGSGKSAIFFRARDVLRSKKDHYVLDLKPESHQLVELKDELEQVANLGAVSHSIVAFWYFIVVSEIVLHIKREAESRRIADPDALKIIEEANDVIGSHEIDFEGDFTTRLNSSTRFLLSEMNARKSHSKEDRLKSLTEAMYSSAIPAAREFIVRNSKIATTFTVLFDNIDKGWSSAGVSDFDIRLVRYLLDALNKLSQDLSAKNREFRSTVFLRNDVFEILLDDTPDRGKSGRVNIDWTDSEKLRQVVLKRLQSSLGGELDFDTLWKSRFCETVDGKPSFDFFIDHCFMRPRFLIQLIELAVGNAVNRGHDQVNDEDCIEAVLQNSYALLDDFGFELRDVSGLDAEVLYYFVGCPQTLSREKITEYLLGGGLEEKDAEEAIRLMLWYGLIGVKRGDNVIYIYDVGYNQKRLNAEIRLNSRQSEYYFNPAIYPALEQRS